MTIEEDVYAALTSGSPASLRVYPDVLPQFPTYPALTYSVIAGTNDFDLQGPSGLIRRLVQVDAWATTRSGAVAAMNEAKILLLASSDFTIDGADVTGAERYDNETKLYRESYEFIIWANE